MPRHSVSAYAQVGQPSPQFLPPAPREAAPASASASAAHAHALHHLHRAASPSAERSRSRAGSAQDRPLRPPSAQALQQAAEVYGAIPYGGGSFNFGGAGSSGSGNNSRPTTPAALGGWMNDEVAASNARPHSPTRSASRSRSRAGAGGAHARAASAGQFRSAQLQLMNANAPSALSAGVPTCYALLNAPMGAAGKRPAFPVPPAAPPASAASSAMHFSPAHCSPTGSSLQVLRSRGRPVSSASVLAASHHAATHAYGAAIPQASATHYAPPQSAASTVLNQTADQRRLALANWLHVFDIQRESLHRSIDIRPYLAKSQQRDQRWHAQQEEQAWKANPAAMAAAAESMRSHSAMAMRPQPPSAQRPQSTTPGAAPRTAAAQPSPSPPPHPSSAYRGGSPRHHRPQSAAQSLSPHELAELRGAYLPPPPASPFQQQQQFPFHRSAMPSPSLSAASPAEPPIIPYGYFALSSATPTQPPPPPLQPLPFAPKPAATGAGMRMSPFEEKSAAAQDGYGETNAQLPSLLKPRFGAAPPPLAQAQDEPEEEDEADRVIYHLHTSARPVDASRALGSAHQRHPSVAVKIPAPLVPRFIDHATAPVEPAAYPSAGSSAATATATENSAEMQGIVFELNHPAHAHAVRPRPRPTTQKQPQHTEPAPQVAPSSKPAAEEEDDEAPAAFNFLAPSPTAHHVAPSSPSAATAAGRAPPSPSAKAPAVVAAPTRVAAPVTTTASPAVARAVAPDTQRAPASVEPAKPVAPPAVAAPVRAKEARAESAVQESTKEARPSPAPVAAETAAAPAPVTARAPAAVTTSSSTSPVLSRAPSVTATAAAAAAPTVAAKEPEPKASPVLKADTAPTASHAVPAAAAAPSQPEPAPVKPTPPVSARSSTSSSPNVAPASTPASPRPEMAVAAPVIVPAVLDSAPPAVAAAAPVAVATSSALAPSPPSTPPKPERRPVAVVVAARNPPSVASSPASAAAPMAATTEPKPQPLESAPPQTPATAPEQKPAAPAAPAVIVVNSRAAATSAATKDAEVADSAVPPPKTVEPAPSSPASSAVVAAPVVAPAAVAAPATPVEKAETQSSPVPSPVIVKLAVDEKRASLSSFSIPASAAAPAVLPAAPAAKIDVPSASVTTASVAPAVVKPVVVLASRAPSVVAVEPSVVAAEPSVTPRGSPPVVAAAPAVVVVVPKSAEPVSAVEAVVEPIVVAPATVAASQPSSETPIESSALAAAPAAVPAAVPAAAESKPDSDNVTDTPHEEAVASSTPVVAAVIAPATDPIAPAVVVAAPVAAEPESSQHTPASEPKQPAVSAEAPATKAADVQPAAPSNDVVAAPVESKADVVDAKPLERHPSVTAPSAAAAAPADADAAAPSAPTASIIEPASSTPPDSKRSSLSALALAAPVAAPAAASEAKTALVLDSAADDESAGMEVSVVEEQLQSEPVVVVVAAAPAEKAVDSKDAPAATAAVAEQESQKPLAPSAASAEAVKVAEAEELKTQAVAAEIKPEPTPAAVVAPESKEPVAAPVVAAAAAATPAVAPAAPAAAPVAEPKPAPAVVVAELPPPIVLPFIAAPASPLCNVCQLHTATMYCADCHLDLCAAGHCAAEIHSAASLRSHGRVPIAGKAGAMAQRAMRGFPAALPPAPAGPLCQSCAQATATLFCHDCSSDLCAEHHCDATLHAASKMTNHVRVPLADKHLPKPTPLVVAAIVAPVVPVVPAVAAAAATSPTVAPVALAAPVVVAASAPVAVAAPVTVAASAPAAVAAAPVQTAEPANSAPIAAVAAPVQVAVPAATAAPAVVVAPKIVLAPKVVVAATPAVPIDHAAVAAAVSSSDLAQLKSLLSAHSGIWAGGSMSEADLRSFIVAAGASPLALLSAQAPRLETHLREFGSAAEFCAWLQYARGVAQGEPICHWDNPALQPVRDLLAHPSCLILRSPSEQSALLGGSQIDALVLAAEGVGDLIGHFERLHALHQSFASAETLADAIKQVCAMGFFLPHPLLNRIVDYVKQRPAGSDLPQSQLFAPLGYKVPELDPEALDALVAQLGDAPDEATRWSQPVEMKVALLLQYLSSFDESGAQFENWESLCAAILQAQEARWPTLAPMTSEQKTELMALFGSDDFALFDDCAEALHITAAGLDALLAAAGSHGFPGLLHILHGLNGMLRRARGFDDLVSIVAQVVEDGAYSAREDRSAILDFLTDSKQCKLFLMSSSSGATLSESARQILRSTAPATFDALLLAVGGGGGASSVSLVLSHLRSLDAVGTRLENVEDILPALEYALDAQRGNGSFVGARENQELVSFLCSGEAGKLLPRALAKRSAIEAEIRAVASSMDAVFVDASGTLLALKRAAESKPLGLFAPRAARGGSGEFDESPRRGQDDDDEAERPVPETPLELILEALEKMNDGPVIGSSSSSSSAGPKYDSLPTLLAALQAKLAEIKAHTEAEEARKLVMLKRLMK